MFDRVFSPGKSDRNSHEVGGDDSRPHAVQAKTESDAQKIAYGHLEDDRPQDGHDEGACAFPYAAEHGGGEHAQRDSRVKHGCDPERA